MPDGTKIVDISLIPADELQRMKERLYANARIDGECWVWGAATNKPGYGNLPITREVARSLGWKNRTLLAHRVSYFLAWGEFPPGTVIDHLCRNPGCFRPMHLEAVSQSVNVRRGLKGTTTHCRKGHPYEGDGLRSDGRHRCNECQRISNEIRLAREAS